MEELEQAYRLLPDTVIITDSYWYILDYNRPGPFEGLKKGRNLTRYMPDCRDRPCGVYARHGRVFHGPGTGKRIGMHMGCCLQFAPGPGLLMSCCAGL